MTADTSHGPLVEMHGVQVTALHDASLTVLKDVNWTVQPGEFWVVAGLPHAGKSDLLLHAAGLIVPGAGSCRVFGMEAVDFGDNQLVERLRLGYVFADGKLFHELTLAENIALPLQYHSGLPADDTVKRVATLLELLELGPFANLKPSSVAAVWRHRAALARALALKPDLLLLDNPNSGLTDRHRRWLVEFLDQLWHGHDFFDRQPVTIVVTTEDLPVWQHPGRRFAAVHAGTFTALGAWENDDFTSHQTIRELLSPPLKRALHP
jgi:phospholipid/cholesterol/gamma-HCH transport system ATP-binding protein